LDFARLRAESADQAAERARAIGRQLLGLHAAARVLFVTGAGTPVWDELLQALLDSYEQRPPEYSVVVLSLHQARNRNVTMHVAEAKTCPVPSLPLATQLLLLASEARALRCPHDCRALCRHTMAQVAVGLGSPLKIERSEPHASVTFIGQVHGDTHHVPLALPPRATIRIWLDFVLGGIFDCAGAVQRLRCGPDAGRWWHC
jgi:hypothetical protein